ncbi:hypothetical protein GCM10022244_31770 [Streptomyces gulbargensis]|uniref:Uncharacterized protein n=1 Tax=Streptomyces gulbargensis TaxID=364901 RepID=A0ABP7MCN1_9ACTN
MNHADGTAPIYAQLIRERGDVPGDVRQVAEEVLRDLSRVIRVPPAAGPGGPAGPAGAMGQGGPMNQGGPMGQGGGMGQGGPMGPGAGLGHGGPGAGHSGVVAAHRAIR